MSVTTASLVSDNVEKWLAASGVDVHGPVTVERVGIGQSNITSIVTDAAGHSWVLREPPSGATGTAHDMRREVMMLDALAATSVPVPRVVAKGDYSDGRSYYAMSKVQGRVLESESDAEALSASERTRIGADVAEVLGCLHQVDPHAVGLATLTSSTPYVRRQIRRVTDMWGHVGADSAHHEQWLQIVAGLATDPPERPMQTIVHGDYRLSNLLIANGTVAAVLDWELATVGDPMVDLAWLLDDWRGPAEPAIAMPSPTRAGGFGSRDDMLETYARTVGFDPTVSGGLDYYRALTLWRAASLIQGVIIRRRSGVMGDHGAIALDALDDTVAALLADSRIHLDRSNR